MKKAEIKERIKLALELRELTQSELAEKAHIDKGQLSSYLSGKYKPRQNNIDALSIALDVNEAWLMGFDVPMERQSSVISSNKLYCILENSIYIYKLSGEFEKTLEAPDTITAVTKLGEDKLKVACKEEVYLLIMD